MDMELHALPDDWSLRALGDVERSTGSTFYYEYNLVDRAGNFLIDRAGDFLIGRTAETSYPQLLHAMPDDFNLRG